MSCLSPLLSSGMSSEPFPLPLEAARGEDFSLKRRELHLFMLKEGTCKNRGWTWTWTLKRMDRSKSLRMKGGGGGLFYLRGRKEGKGRLERLERETDIDREKSERLGDEVEKVVEEKRVKKTASSRVRKTVRGTKRSVKQISSKFESLSSDDSIESNNEFRNTPDISLSLRVENVMQSSLCSTEVLESLANHLVKSKNMDHNHERDKFESFHTSNKVVESTSDYPEESIEMDQNSERNMFVMSERWAGPAFVNSPHPSALPFPCFQRRTKERSPPWQQIYVREGEISATNDLKRILKLNL